MVTRERQALIFTTARIYQGQTSVAFGGMRFHNELQLRAHSPDTTALIPRRSHPRISQDRGWRVRTVQHSLACSPAPPAAVDILLPAHLGGHLGVVLLEALGEAGLCGHCLCHAAGDAAVLARRDSLGCEVVDAGHEAVVDQASEELRARRKGAGVSQMPRLGG